MAESVPMPHDHHQWGSKYAPLEPGNSYCLLVPLPDDWTSPTGGVIPPGGVAPGKPLAPWCHDGSRTEPAPPTPPTVPLLTSPPSPQRGWLRRALAWVTHAEAWRP